MFRIAHYTEHLPTSPLEQLAIWPWYSSTYYNSVGIPNGGALGAQWALTGDIKVGGGNSFMLVKADAALTKGQLVSWAIPTVGGTVTGASTTSVLTITGGGLVAQAHVGKLLWLNNTTGGANATLKRVRSNTTTTITIAEVDPYVASKPFDADVLAVAPTNADLYTMVDPYHVIVNTATTIPIGVALGTVTQDYYTIIQTSGIGIFSAVGNGTALVVNQPAVGGAAGVILGSGATAGGYMGAGSINPMHATAAASLFIPCQFNFLGNI